MHFGATLKNNSVSCRGEFILRLYPATYFFKNYNISAIFRPIFKRFSPLYTERSMNYTRKKIFRNFFFISRPPGWFLFASPGRQETDLLFSVASDMPLESCLQEASIYFL